MIRTISYGLMVIRATFTTRMKCFCVRRQGNISSMRRVGHYLITVPIQVQPLGEVEKIGDNTVNSRRSKGMV